MTGSLSSKSISKMTNRELLELGIKRLEKAGIEDAEIDAGILFEYVTGMDRSAVLVHGGEEAGTTKGPQDTVKRFESLIAERASHRPVQYITGMADFMGLRFIVNENVLIPRFDTEYLVEEMLKEAGDGSSVLDMCTGSGCILLSLMRYKNNIRGTGADISDAALDVARSNEELIFGAYKADEDNGNESVFSEHNNAEWIQSDMFENITGTYDYIICNPPYIRSGVIPDLMPEVRDHEPHAALDGDKDGLKFYRIIAEEARAFLNRNGKLFLEIGYDEGDAVSSLLAEHEFQDVRIIKDYSRNDRVVTGAVSCLKM